MLVPFGIEQTTLLLAARSSSAGLLQGDNVGAFVSPAPRSLHLAGAICQRSRSARALLPVRAATGDPGSAAGRRILRLPCAPGAMLGHGGDDFRLGWVKWVIEQPQCELDAQHTAHSLIDRRHPDRPDLMR